MAVVVVDCEAAAGAGAVILQRSLSCTSMLLRKDVASSNGLESSSLKRCSTSQYDSCGEE